MFDIANWGACLNGENGPGGTPSHEALSVSPQGALEISPFIGQPPSLDRNHFSTPRVVAESHKRDERCRPSFQRPQYPTVYRHLKRRLGPHLEQDSTKGLWSDREKQTRRNSLGGAVRSPLKDHDLVPSLPDNLKSQTHSRVSECDG